MTHAVRLLIGALAVGVLTAAPTHAYDITVKYLGVTDQKFDGYQGYFAPHRACRKKFGRESVWCTSEMIINGGPAAGVADISGPEAESAWVQPAPRGGAQTGVDGYFVDFSLRSGQVPNRDLSCWGWNAPSPNLPAGSGLVIQQGANGPTFNNRTCGGPQFLRPAACCGPARTRRAP